MSEFTIKMASFCMERNKLVGSSNFLAWKKNIDLILVENEVNEYVKGFIAKPSQEQAQALLK